MRFMQRSLMGLFLLGLTIGLLALAGGSLRATIEARLAKESKSRPAQERVFAVNVVRAERISTQPRLTAFGEIRSRRTLDIRAPVSGTVVSLAPDYIEGGRVAQGETLLVIDPADAQSALDVSRADRDEAVNELREAENALSLARDELEAARKQVSLRLTALERQQNLVTRGVGTEAAVETAALAHASAEQAVLGKRAALAQVETRINRAKTGLARVQVRLSEAERRLENTEVFAEFDGVLSGVTVVQGGMVGTNEKIGRLVDPAALEVAFRLSNSQFNRLITANGGEAAGEVSVRLDLLGEDLVVTGVIERVSAEVGAGQTGRQVFASLVGDSLASYRPGDFVTVEVAEPELQNVAILPATAVDAASNVLVIGENDRLDELAVTVLRRQGDEVIVRGADLFGRNVVEARSPLLGAGIRVKPVARDAAMPDEPDMIELTAERRAKLVAFIEASTKLPADAKERILGRLNQDRVPVEMVNRIESRMGG
jgi:multidrug resistance efflux pump